MPETACKVLTCCDLDDFPMSSSGAGNCPVGWQWDGTSCVRCAIPAAPSLTASAGIILVEFSVDTDLPYQVQRFSDGHWMTLLEATGVGAVVYDDVAVTPGTAYSYRISVVVGAQCGSIEGESASAVAI